MPRAATPARVPVARSFGVLTACIAGCLFPVSGTPAGFHWDDPVPISPPAAEGSHRFHELLRAPGPGFHLRAIVTRREARYSVRGYDLSVDGDLDWESAWANRREFTYDNGTRQNAYEIHAAMDAAGHLHAVYEAFDLHGGKSLHIGYKRDDTDGWTAAIAPRIVSEPGANDCTGANPGVCIGRAPDGTEWVHVLYHRRPILGGDVGPACQPFAYVHRAMPILASGCGGDWGTETLFTDAFLEQEYSVAGEGGVGLMPCLDRRGRIHAIGRRRTRDTVDVYHLVGTQRERGGAWETSRTILDSMPFVGQAAPYHEPPFACPAQLVCGGPPGAESLDVVWGRNVPEGDGFRREVWFARLDLERNEWSIPLRLSAMDGSSAFNARIARSDDGKLHVVYHAATPGSDRIGLRYRRADGDPRVADGWSAAETLEDPDQGLLGPVFVADADTLWLGYTTELPGRPPAQRWQAWFRKGYATGVHPEG